jgi:hypothetical protein
MRSVLEFHHPGELVTLNFRGVPKAVVAVDLNGFLYVLRSWWFILEEIVLSSFVIDPSLEPLVLAIADPAAGDQ